MLYLAYINPSFHIFLFTKFFNFGVGGGGGGIYTEF